MDRKLSSSASVKSKTKAKSKKLKSNKESSICLDVDLWEQNEDRFTSITLPSDQQKKPFNSSLTPTVKPTKVNKSCMTKETISSTASPIQPVTTLGGVDSHAALIALDTNAQSDAAEPERGNWTGRFDFLLSLLGYSVGLGNVWRFPYLCYNNGGGAFLIPFTIMLIIAGLPLMFMELSFGQYAALGPVAIYRRFCPLFRGLGTGMVIVSAIVMLYYNLIIAWTIFYMFASFRTELPWQNCEPEWSTENCFSYEIADKCEALNGTFYLRVCYNATYAEEHNITEMTVNALKRPPAEEYFNNYVLGLSSGIEETGGIKISLAICLFCAWVIVFLCLCKGVQSSGKVVYFTALFPYVVLVILFVRGVTLPGAATGILFYLTPDWKQLANAQVWGDAAVQIFFALSPAWGGLITLSSYNKFSNNCYKDSLIVAVCNIGTSFFAGLVIFSIIGFLAHELDVEVEKVVDQGAGLAFIVYPEVVTRLPISPVWAVLFFVMLLTLGLDSQFALMETVTTAILDKFPNLRQYKTWVVLFVGVFGYIGGIGFTTRSGMYWLQLMDKYAANWSVLLIAISECVLIAWIYGSQRFLNDIQGMIGKRSRSWNTFWSLMWRFITPATLLFILFFNWVEYKPATYGHYVYPLWADAVGWIVGLLPVFVIFAVAFQQICKAPDSMGLRERIKYLVKPTAEWGPAGRPCINLHAERYESENYDAVANTSILTEGLPTDLSIYEDNLTVIYRNGNAIPPKHLSSTIASSANKRLNEESIINGGTIVKEGVFETPPKVSIKSADQRPGPGILKVKKNCCESSSEAKSSQQSLMPSGDKINSLAKDCCHPNGTGEEKIIKVTATIILPTTKTAANTLKTFATTTTQVTTSDCFNAVVSNGSEVALALITSTSVATGFGLAFIPINTRAAVKPFVPTKLISTLTTAKTSSTVLGNTNAAIISPNIMPANTNQGHNTTMQTLNYSLTAATKPPIASTKVTLDSKPAGTLSNNKSSRTTSAASSAQSTAQTTNSLNLLHGDNSNLKTKPVRTEMSHSAAKLVGNTPVTQVVVEAATSITTASTNSKYINLMQNSNVITPPFFTTVGNFNAATARAATTSTIKSSKASNENQIKFEKTCSGTSQLFETATKASTLSITSSLSSASRNSPSSISKAAIEEVLPATLKMQKATKPAFNTKATTTLTTTSSKPQTTFAVKEISTKPIATALAASKTVTSATSNIFNTITTAATTLVKVQVDNDSKSNLISAPVRSISRSAAHHLSM
uniref:Transporter n=1 Tax=Glossina pallidipes TaxID=7398 RepID=A0A1A9ZWE0_GLOPL